MTSKEAAVYRLKQLKGKPLKAKAEHLITYYRGPLLSVLIALMLCGFLLFHFATHKEEVLHVVCLNSFAKAEDADLFCQEFAQAAGIDLEKETVYLNTSLIVSDATPGETYEAIQSLSAKAAAGTVDVLMADWDALGIFLYGDYFRDLTQVLTPEQQTRLQEHMLYIDLVYLEAKLSGAEVPTPYPDPTKPEDMEQPVPVALLLPQENGFRQLNYGSLKTPIALGFVANSDHTQNALAFLDYIFPEA